MPVDSQALERAAVQALLEHPELAVANASPETPRVILSSKIIKSRGLIVVLSEAIRRADRFCEDAGGKLYHYNEGVYRPDGEHYIRRRVRELLGQWGQESNWSTRLAAEVVEHIRVQSERLWDRPLTTVLNLKNGLLDVVTGQLSNHSPDHLSSVQLPVEYDPEATCPAWDKFIAATFPADAVEVGYQIPALLMTPYTSAQKAILFTGEGANGKSTYFSALQAFIGRQNCVALSLHALEGNRFATVRLLGKLAVLCPDLPSEHLASTSTFKAIVGEDSLAAEYKFGHGFDFVPFTRLVFSSNHPPRSSDSSEAFFRRWLVVPFDNIFSPNTPGYIPRDELDAMLATPQELSGVLNKALIAYRRIRARGLLESPSMRQAWNELRQATDPLAAWLDAATVDGPGLVVSQGAVISAYNAACERAGRPPMTQTRFGRALRRLRQNVESAQRTRLGRVQWCYIGIALRVPEETG